MRVHDDTRGRIACQPIQFLRSFAWQLIDLDPFAFASNRMHMLSPMLSPKILYS